VVNKRQLTGSEWLEDRMSALGLSSLEQAAQRCSLNRGNLYRYFTFETRPSIDVIPLLCEGLDAAPEEVFRALGIQLPKK
jgi:transcriptional regulator with XRE-family HTH domain